MARTPKGEVAILNKDGWIQLRWRYQGQRRYLSLGLRYDAINLEVGQQRATQIRLDLLSGNYDETLRKYQANTSQQSDKIGAVALFQRFIDWKSKRVQSRTLEKYHGLLNWLREYFGDRPADVDNAEEFVAWLLENMEPVTAKERLGLLKAAWDWGIENECIAPKGNVWKDLDIRKPPKQRPKAFTKEEVHQVIKGFEQSSSYRHYTDYVRFKFMTGVRTGEANGLRWRHLNDDCSVVWIGETHTHGQFKDTKTGKAREVKLSASTATMLRSHITESTEGDDLVFPAPRGGVMNEHNFRRVWKAVLESVGVRYIRPYDTRCTFISHCLEQGMNPVEVASITGHDVKTLYRDYAGLIKSHPQAPELF